jgi:hypothetical protein
MYWNMDPYAYVYEDTLESFIEAPAQMSGTLILTHTTDHFASMFNNAEFSDFQFLFPKSGNALYVHKVIISYSSVIRAMVKDGMQESIQSRCVVEDDEAVFCLMIRSMYCTSLKVPMNQMILLMIMADKYQLKPLFDTCCTFLLQNINFRNCLDLWTLEQDKKYSALINAATQRIRSTIWYIIQQRCYVILDYDEFKIFLNQFCSFQEDSYDIIKTWINHDITSRNCLFHRS